MSVSRDAERIYSVLVARGGAEVESLAWINAPPGRRPPGPFPAPNRFHIGSGFPNDLARPVLAFDKPMPTAGPLLDAYEIGVGWVVNSALKATLDEIDAAAFDSVLAETEFPDGVPGPAYWLVDLVRFIDCYDEERSLTANPKVMDRGVVNFAFDGSYFRASTIGAASFFRIPQSLSWLCTARAKQRVEGAGHNVLNFIEVGWAI